MRCDLVVAIAIDGTRPAVKMNQRKLLFGHKLCLSLALPAINSAVVTPKCARCATSPPSRGTAAYPRRPGAPCRAAGGEPAGQGPRAAAARHPARAHLAAVTLTPEGAGVLADCRRVLAGADRAARRVRAAARGEAEPRGWSPPSSAPSRPWLAARAPRQGLPAAKGRRPQGLRQRRRHTPARRRLRSRARADDDLSQRDSPADGPTQVLRVAVGESHRFADRDQIGLARLRDETLELSPHEMRPTTTTPSSPPAARPASSPASTAPAPARRSGLHSRRPRNRPRRQLLGEQLPHGVKLVDLAPPRPMLTRQRRLATAQSPHARTLLRGRETTRGGTPPGVMRRACGLLAGDGYRSDR